MSEDLDNKYGPWHWYFGSDDDDDEMCEAASRDDAIAGDKAALPGETFYIVEARMLAEHEAELDGIQRDTAPFAETRNGEFIEPTEQEIVDQQRRAAELEAQRTMTDATIELAPTEAIQ